MACFNIYRHVIIYKVGNNLFQKNCVAVKKTVHMCQGTIFNEKSATPTHYRVGFAPNCVANCSATPDKLARFTKYRPYESE